MSRRSLVLAVLACCAGGPARAATVAVTETLDLAQVVVGPTSLAAVGPPGFEPPPTFTLAEGDTLALTVDFAGAQTVTLSNPSQVWAYVFANGSPSDVLQSGTISFLGADGAVIARSALKTDVEGEVSVGQTFSRADFAGLPPALTFHGVRYDGVLVDYLAPGVDSRAYTVPGLTLAGDALVVSTVPEPTPAVLLLAGAAVLALRGRVRGRP